MEYGKKQKKSEHSSDQMEFRERCNKRQCTDRTGKPMTPKYNREKNNDIEKTENKRKCI